LTDYLREPSLGLSVVQDTAVANLRVVCSGPIPPNPSELLGSHRMTEFLQLARANAAIDLVILDSSPALVVTDPSVLAPHVDGVLLVVDEEKSKLRATQRTVQRFTLVGSKVLGVVINKFDPRAGGSGSYGYYDQSGYYKSEQGREGNSGDPGKQGDQSTKNGHQSVLLKAAQPGALSASTTVGDGHGPARQGAVARVIAGLIRR
jgi:Mrp family chromosome partitioning ATPase